MPTIQPVEAKKFIEGEKVEFEDVIIKTVESRFGEGKLVTFIDAEGNVVRKTFAGGLVEFLQNNVGVKAVKLKRVIHDGEFTQNLWARAD